MRGLVLFLPTAVKLSASSPGELGARAGELSNSPGRLTNKSPGNKQICSIACGLLPFVGEFWPPINRQKLTEKPSEFARFIPS